MCIRLILLYNIYIHQSYFHYSTYSIVEVDGLHKSVPKVNHIMEHVQGRDKMDILAEILHRHVNKKHKTLVFCNTIDSCRAVDYYMRDPSSYSYLDREAGLQIVNSVVSYHGGLNSREREANIDRLRNGTAEIMVCTDIAARGLDIPAIGHVILFDFPLNPVDYIHRAGRTGRAGRKGLVTSIIAKRDEV